MFAEICTCAHLSSRQNKHVCSKARMPGRRQEAEDQECDWFRESRIFPNFAALLLLFFPRDLVSLYPCQSSHMSFFCSELRNSFNFPIYFVIFNCLSLTNENQRVESPIKSAVEFIEAAFFLNTMCRIKLRLEPPVLWVQDSAVTANYSIFCCFRRPVDCIKEK